ncbi:MAG: N-acetylglucosamine-6-phosphate deacetylase [Gemmataceae bacterium]|nr:N-acetylglucosamine-6-phosphate deacetylase [Gemmataceae bacterium]
MRFLFTNGTIVLPDRLLEQGQVEVVGRYIRAIDAASTAATVPHGTHVVDLNEGFLVPGFVDLHVHGGAGHDFMDATEEAFRAICQAHARHGTTSLLATTTVARHEQHMEFLRVCHNLCTPPQSSATAAALGGTGRPTFAAERAGQLPPTGGARILGAHFYGPYFAKEARGCHPGAAIRPPRPDEYLEYLSFGSCIRRASVAPELPGAETFVRACRALGIGCNAGHTHATFAQMEAARSWGITHVDHLFCAMSDRARLRQEQTYPMRGGVVEATLYFYDLSTEVIADGKHLAAELLKLAYKIKGPGALALVTDCNRALEMPDGEYVFGPRDGGEPILRRDDVGLMPDGKALASGVMGMDHGVRTMLALTGAPLVDVIRMATLTPARIAGADKEIGSIEIGKVADLVVLNRDLHVREVYIGGAKL